MNHAPAPTDPHLIPRWRVWSALVLLLGCATASVWAAESEPPVELVMHNYVPDWLDNPVTICVNRFIAANPDVVVKPFSNLKLPGAAGLGGDSTMLMAFAGGIAPDVVWVWFHKLEAYTRQGFCLDLSEFIGEDTDGDGYISDAEAKWAGWKHIRPNLRRAITIDRKPYGLPFADTTVAIVYRRDLVREVTGREDPPRNWDEFFRICQLLTRPAETQPDGSVRKSRAGYFADTYSFRWLPWLWSAGGQEIMQGRTSPTDGQTYWFSKDETLPRSPSGEDLGRLRPVWKATFASAEGKQAVEFYWRLFHQPWLRDPESGEAINLTREQAAAGTVTLPDGRTLRFTERKLFRGVSRGLLGDNKEGAGDLFRKGEICFYIGSAGDLNALTRELSPAQVGLMPVPSPDGSRVAAMQQPIFFALNSALANASPRKRQAAWRLLEAVTGDSFTRAGLELARDQGLLRFADPEELRRFDLDEYAGDVAPHWVEQLRRIKEHSSTEPYVGFWQPVSDDLIGQQILSRVLVDPNFDYRAALDLAQDQANNKVMRGRDEAQMQRLRSWAWGVFAVVMGFLVWVTRRIWQGMKAAYMKPASLSQGEAMVRVERGYTRWLPWLFIGPALVLVLMWTYYPLGQGAVMAFQDYKVLADKPLVGLDNFITVLLDPKFYKFLWITWKFVVVNIALGFLSPIVLAIMLNEIPRGKLSLRMMFLLPQVSSGLVIAFIWQMMYDPTEVGFFNSVLLQLGLIARPLQFLNDPNWALLWVTMLSVWAGIGGGSLIYLAALKTVSEDLYEAAETDGAGIWQKLWRITVPTLLPIILINFVGSFIGLFKSMGNIFLLTGGGPGDETTVISLAIWRDSFIYLKFGTATATAWVLAALLASFTLVQLRILSRVEFRRAEE